MTPGPVKPLQSLPTQTTPWHLQETYKSLITISVECLKMLAIVNGGAAVAVLTYLGTWETSPVTRHLANLQFTSRQRSCATAAAFSLRSSRLCLVM